MKLTTTQSKKKIIIFVCIILSLTLGSVMRSFVYKNFLLTFYEAPRLFVPIFFLTEIFVYILFGYFIGILIKSKRYREVPNNHNNSESSNPPRNILNRRVSTPLFITVTTLLIVMIILIIRIVVYVINFMKGDVSSF